MTSNFLGQFCPSQAVSFDVLKAIHMRPLRPFASVATVSADVTAPLVAPSPAALKGIEEVGDLVPFSSTWMKSGALVMVVRRPG